MKDAMLSYDMYLKTATEDEKEIIEKISNQAALSKEAIEKIKSIKKDINILAFAEPYCKDCAVVLSFLVKISKLNENINIKILPRKNNEDILEKYNKDKRIPTIINLDNKEKNIFSEFPDAVHKEVINGQEDKKTIISNFRNGEYNSFVEGDLLKILI